MLKGFVVVACSVECVSCLCLYREVRDVATQFVERALRLLWAALAVVSAAEIAVYLFLFEDQRTPDILPLLWISCWILLYAQGDPLLISVAARCRRGFTRFLRDPKNAGGAVKEETVL